MQCPKNRKNIDTKQTYLDTVVDAGEAEESEDESEDSGGWRLESVERLRARMSNAECCSDSLLLFRLPAGLAATSGPLFLSHSLRTDGSLANLLQVRLATATPSTTAHNRRRSPMGPGNDCGEETVAFWTSGLSALPSGSTTEKMSGVGIAGIGAAMFRTRKKPETPESRSRSLRRHLSTTETSFVPTTAVNPTSSRWPERQRGVR